LAKIAVNSRSAQPSTDEQPRTVGARIVAAGSGWSVEDVICARGPQDRRFEEQHDRFVIAIVTSGTFQYRSSGAGSEAMMTPGSLLLGSPGQCFECGHEHGVGDRCLSFQFTSGYFSEIAPDPEGHQALRGFRSAKLSPVRTLSPLVAEACAALSGSPEIAWEELGVQLIARALQLDDDRRNGEPAASPAAIARVTESVRAIDDDPASDLTLVRLAKQAGLSPFHFLRTFERATGTTPHQYMLRTRLRKAAVRLAADKEKIVDVAFAAGFGDISNFNRAFRAEFGVSPTRYRQRRRR
jgi:AraC family transcriptional regulator